MEFDKKWDLVLGSQSPRRKELLSHLNIPFRIKVSSQDEVVKGNHSGEIACNIALEKANHIWDDAKRDLSNPFLVTADTIVVLKNKIYGKPRNIDEAKKILRELSGKTHEVITGVNFRYRRIGDSKDSSSNEFTDETFYDLTHVTFSDIGDELLELYLRTGDSLDKAGAYGIQGGSLTFISHVEGSYSNVVGFPLDKIVLRLQSIFGADWRQVFIR